MITTDRPLTTPTNFKLDVFLDTLPGGVIYMPSFRQFCPCSHSAILLLAMMQRIRKKQFGASWFSTSDDRLQLTGLTIPQSLCDSLGLTRNEVKASLEKLINRKLVSFVGGRAVFEFNAALIQKKLGV